MKSFRSDFLRWKKVVGNGYAADYVTKPYNAINTIGLKSLIASLEECFERDKVAGSVHWGNPQKLNALSNEMK